MQKPLLTNVDDTIFCKLRVSELHKADYNRPISQSRVQKIVDNYMPDLIGALRVNKRNGVYYVIDGQHRLEALKILGIAQVMCEVSHNLSYQEEAYLYVKLDTERKNLSRGALGLGKIESGDKKWLEIKKLINSCGLELEFNRSRGQNKVCAIEEVEKAYDELGPALFKRMFVLIKKTWNGSPKSLDNRIFAGMRIFVLKADKYFSDSDFVSKMREFNPTEIIIQGKTAYRNDLACYSYAKSILSFYNFNRKNKRIPEHVVSH